MPLKGARQPLQVVGVLVCALDSCVLIGCCGLHALVHVSAAACVWLVPGLRLGSSPGALQIFHCTRCVPLVRGRGNCTRRHVRSQQEWHVLPTRIGANG
jgi:hypothetical protein